MSPPVVPNSKTYFHPNPLNANCGRYCRPRRLDSSERSGRTGWKSNRETITVSRRGVAINRTFDEDQTLQASQSGSLACIEGQLCEKHCSQHRLDKSAENDVESQTLSS